ncbi:MAG TPA: DCC1-like thiol-disulfide oxidoreductase family protein [Mycobacteriales bacterium]|nr:DCC1-like thiol-disulfide oxidoreductase family protein [Mycobacteriales bacterium]
MKRTREYDGTLVYDGDCAFCTRCVRWMERRLPLRPRVVAWQQADLAGLGLTQQACEDAVQWVEPSGRRAAGAAAVAWLLVLSGGMWRVPGRLMLTPPISWLAAGVYRLVARNRGRLPGGSAACALPQADRDALTDDELAG